MTEKDFTKLSKEESLALAYESTASIRKSLERLYSRCCYPINENTPEEDEIFNQEEFDSKKAEWNKKAIDILRKNFSWQIDDNDDLFEALGVTL